MALLNCRNNAQFYVNFGRILWNNGETMVDLPPDCANIFDDSYIFNNTWIRVSGLFYTALQINPTTSSAYSALADILATFGPHESLQLPDGRRMNETQLRNECSLYANMVNENEFSVHNNLKQTQVLPHGTSSPQWLNFDKLSAEATHSNSTLNGVNKSELFTPTSTDATFITLRKDKFAQINDADAKKFISNLNSVVVVDSGGVWCADHISDAFQYLYLKVPKGKNLIYTNSGNDMDDIDTFLSRRPYDSEKILDHINKCLLIIRTTNNTTESEPNINTSRKRSRAMLLLVLLYLILDIPNDKFEPPSNVANLSPDTACDYLANYYPDYMADAKNILNLYLQALHTAHTIFDVLYLLCVAIICRYDRRYGRKNIKKSKQYFGGSHSLIQEFRKVVKGSGCWEEIGEFEWKWYSIIDSKYFSQDMVITANISPSPHQDKMSDLKCDLKIKSEKMAADEWEQEKIYDPNFSSTIPTMNELMDLTGLENVKCIVLQLYRRTLLEKLRGIKGCETPLNFRFVGNPGTGKTIVARILARILAELGLRPGITKEQEMEAKDKEEIANRDRSLYELDKLQELQEQVKKEQCELRVASANERVQGLVEALSAVRTTVQATSNVSC
jgi:hypothetical protein